MQLFRFLLTSSRPMLVASIIVGASAGMASAYILAKVNESIHAIGSLGAAAALAFSGLALLAVGSELASRLILLRMSSSAIRRMRLSLCDQILRAPLRVVERHGASGLMGALTDDIHRVTDALLALPAQCVNLAITIGCFAYLFWLSWPLAVAFLLIFATGILAHELITRIARPHMTEGRQNWDALIANYSAVVNGNKELKLNAERRIALRERDLRATADRMFKTAWRANSTVAVGTALTQLVFFALIGISLYVAPLLRQYEPNVLTGFVLMALFMSGPIASLVGASPKLHLADIALKKIQSLGLKLERLDESDILEAPPPPSSGAAFSSLQLRGVAYRYETEVSGDAPFALAPMDITLRKGELVFVVGGNGSGKSSFVRVLTGLYPPTEGQILLDGVVIDPEERDLYRQNFSAVFSDYHLFHSLYGPATAAFKAHAQAYLERLELAGKVTLHDDRLSTVALSQGQRKRLALLVAFLEDRNVYVFDEWAADQDPVFKRVFYHHILPELRAGGKTIVVVSHDDQYFDSADRLIRFAEGRVVEDRRIAAAATEVEEVNA